MRSAGICLLLSVSPLLLAADFILLDPHAYRDFFVEGRPSPSAGEVNESTFEWAKSNVPFFDVDDPDILRSYYFRLKTYKSHIIPTELVDAPYLISEFGPAVHWGGAYGTINAAAGHHIHEGRWIRDADIIDSYVKFWYRGGHFANGTHVSGKTPYSSWIITAALARAHVSGSVAPLKDLLQDMVKWFDARTQQTRQDCVFPSDQGGWPGCLSIPPNESKHPQCYGILDGWDAMERSISGAGCRPTIHAMMVSEAEAIAELAEQLGDTSLARNFSQRAEWSRQAYLDLLWDDDLDFFSVYKVNFFNNGNWHCNCSDNPTCPNPDESWQSSAVSANFRADVGNKPGCAPLWPCNQTVKVRELLGLGPAYYFKVVPPSSSGPSKYEKMWPQLFDPEGFWAEWGPTTAERRHRCFNMTLDGAECAWSAPSWPYETSRVLTGLANLLADYPAAQSEGIVNSTSYVKLLRTYARSHTQSHAANGTVPWVGENIEPDKGYWVAREIMYRGGEHPAPVNCAECIKDPRPRNCGGRTTVLDCCLGTTPSCDGDILPTEDRERGKDYNHSTFMDLIIAGLVGLRAAFGALFTVHPLVDSSISHFALDNVPYHGHNLSIAYSNNASKVYSGCPLGSLCVWVDGEAVSSTVGLAPVNITLKSANSTDAVMHI